MEAHIRRKKIIRLGSGFGESIAANRNAYFSKPSADTPRTSYGWFISLAACCCFFVLLMGRLFYLTIVNGAYYRDLGENNRIHEERIAPIRGVIYSRDGEVLASNRPVSKRCMSTDECRLISHEEALEYEARGEKVTVQLGRTYPKKESVAHAVGYVGEITEEQLPVKNEEIRSDYHLPSEEFCQFCYEMGDYTGISGVEETFESILRGTPGKRLVEVDSFGKELQELAKVDAIPGKNVYVSIHAQLQEQATLVLERVRHSPGYNGLGAAVIATDPKSGEVLLLYSSPSYDSNLFVNEELDSSLLTSLLTDPQQPLFNRAISGLYPPGSTFKIVPAVAALEEGNVQADTIIEDTGIISIGSFSFSNWYYTQYGRTEGAVDIVKAISRSNDIFFYKLGEWTGVTKIEEWAKKFGLTEPIDIGISGSVPGSVRRKRDWYLGDTYHLAIGQGDLLATPLHVNTWTQIIADDGMYCQPTILKRDPPSQGDSYLPATFSSCKPIGLKPETLHLVQEGMRQSCSSGGTAWPLFDFGIPVATDSADRVAYPVDGKNYIQEPGKIRIPVACKTGTAEFGSPEEKRTHAWLTAFAPIDDPEIVVTVLIEGGGEGSSVAGPVVKEILEEWFGKGRE
ncbi:hypothetical protein HY468_01220 [Candidatus Roizmanbacteria bacterium]|nr:hypothetical protein [Candidatus Roizmanbacteria bacterium]